jgi:DNA mismatch endonuclease (patch repair protein)
VESPLKSLASERMRGIRRAGTAPELAVRKVMYSLGFRYRLNDKRLPGSPDIVCPKWKAVVFVHGCFWHGHACKKARLPKSNTEFWRAKRNANRERDARKQRELEVAGWRVFIVWGCEAAHEAILFSRLEILAKQVRDVRALDPEPRYSCVRTSGHLRKCSRA